MNETISIAISRRPFGQPSWAGDASSIRQAPGCDWRQGVALRSARNNWGGGA